MKGITLKHHLQLAAKKRWKNKTPEEIKAHMAMMRKARLKKKKVITNQ